MSPVICDYLPCHDITSFVLPVHERNGPYLYCNEYFNKYLIMYICCTCRCYIASNLEVHMQSMLTHWQWGWHVLPCPFCIWFISCVYAIA